MDKYHLEFILPGLPKTTNSKRLFGHWSQYHRESKKWKKYIYNLVLSNRPPVPLEKAMLTLIRASSSEPDFDGLVSSFKHVVDGLVEARVIANDKMQNIGQSKYLWEKAPRGKGFIKVIVESV